MVQLLGIAAGSTETTPPMSDFGFFVVVFDSSVLRPLDKVKQEADKLADSIRSTKMLPGERPTRMPFDRSAECRRDAQMKGSFTIP